MEKEMKIMELLNDFRKKVDKEFKGETPKITGEFDKLYDCDIYIYRHPGMGNSKQIISGNKPSIMAATSSYLESLIKQGVITEGELKHMIKLVTDAVKGKLK